MVKLLRGITQYLPNQNRAGKFVLYAIGEITLVVIGILIALYINNWNEERKNRSFELTMLREVKDAIEADVKILEDVLPYLKSTVYSIYQLAVIKSDPSQPTDSLYFHLQKTLNFGTILAINKSPFEAIESSGLDKISNPSIRTNLSTLYGYELPDSELWINEVLRIELFKKKELFSQIFGLKVLPADGNSIEMKVILDNPAIIYNNPEFDVLLHTAAWTLPRTQSKVENLISQMKALSTQIDTELKNE